MASYPIVNCRIDTAGRLSLSMTEFPSSMEAEFRVYPSDCGAYSPRAGDILSFVLREGFYETPAAGSSAALSAPSDPYAEYLTTYLTVPVLLSTDTTLSDPPTPPLTPLPSPGADLFAPISARVTLSHTESLLSTNVLAFSYPVWLYPVSTSPVVVPDEEDGYFIRGPNGVLYRLSIAILPETSEPTLTVEET